ncbi:hypothetical protein SEMRO_1526_G279790.1 [Seminavis robusta]|uniref:Uncharacterized protein n=1 Tax=Seminavis robusta TaxID=568900 RepID=A0A9N8EM72_9STRA|nr:hypothetical protein SEMRO_1526_G279790.1 [Seminavis robusta]|eukprot:Sro1526_g279790.1 n/a (1179) ;mRNA; r:15470-19006
MEETDLGLTGTRGFWNEMSEQDDATIRLEETNDFFIETQYDYDSNPPPLSSITGAEEKYISFVEKKINQAISKAWDDAIDLWKEELREVLKPEPSRRREVIPVYFDGGLEVGFDDPNLNVLPWMEKTEKILKSWCSEKCVHGLAKNQRVFCTRNQPNLFVPAFLPVRRPKISRSAEEVDRRLNRGDPFGSFTREHLMRLRERNVDQNRNSDEDSNNETEPEVDNAMEREIIDASTRHLLDGGDNELEFILESSGREEEDPWLPDLKFSKWPQLNTVKAIGGTHSGKIPLCLMESETGEGETKRTLADPNVRNKVSGGQIYIPMTKRIFQFGDALDNSEIEALPARVYTLLNHKGTLAPKRGEEITNMVIDTVRKLRQRIKNTRSEILANHKKNIIRFEIFFPTDTEGKMEYLEDRDDYASSFVVSNCGQLMTQFADSLEEFITPVYSVFGDKQSIDRCMGLSSPAKGLLLICTERAVELCGSDPAFKGRLTTKITENSDLAGKSWHICRNLLQEISGREKDFIGGTPFGLSTDLMIAESTEEQMEQEGRSQRPKKLPVHVQVFQRLADMGVDHIVFFMRRMLDINCALFRATDICMRNKKYLDYYRDHNREDPNTEDPPEYVPPKRDIFLKPNFALIAKLSDMDSLGEVVTSMCQIIYDAYYHESSCLIRDEIRKYFAAFNKKNRAHKVNPWLPPLSDFPKTDKQLNKFCRDVSEKSVGGVKMETAKGTWKQKQKVTDGESFESLICCTMSDNQSLAPAWERSVTRNLIRYCLTILDKTKANLTDDNGNEINEDLDEVDFGSEEAQREGLMNAYTTPQQLLSSKSFRSHLMQTFIDEAKKAHEESKPLIYYATQSKRYQRPTPLKDATLTFKIEAVELDVRNPEAQTRNPGRKRKREAPPKPQAPQAIEPIFPYEKNKQSPATTAEINQLFTFAGRLNYRTVLIIRCLVFVAMNVEIAAEPGAWMQYVHMCQLTNATRLHELFKTKDAMRRAVKAAFDKCEFKKHLSYREWYHSVCKPFGISDPLDNTNNTSEPKANAAGGKGSNTPLGPLLRAAMYNANFWVWDRQSGPQFKTLSQYDEEDKRKVYVSRNTQGMTFKTLLDTHASLGLITPGMTDGLKELTIRAWENPNAEASGQTESLSPTRGDRGVGMAAVVTPGAAGSGASPHWLDQQSQADYV